jgi:hypothetical protein
VSVTALSVRTYVRYVVPLTALSALVFAPLLFFAWRAKLPVSAPEGKALLRLSWMLVGASLLPLLVLVGGVAPAVRSIAAGRPASQLRALWDGVRGSVRTAVPALLAIVAVLIGGLAFAVPGVVLLVLFAMTGASTRAGAARLADAAALARSRRTALVLAGTLAATLLVHAAAVFLTQRGIVLPPKPQPEHFAPLIWIVRVAATAIALVAPISAVVVAAVYSAHSADRSS